MRPLVISGPSGVGKGTLIRMLFDHNPGRFAFSVSHTTRQPRPTETNGIHYHFVSGAAFDDLIAQDGFIEWAKFGPNRYGTSKAALMQPQQQQQEQQSEQPDTVASNASDKTIVLDIEMEGVKQVKKSGIPARFVFIAPPSYEVLEERLRARGTEQEASIVERLKQARNEMDFAQQKDVHDITIVNDDLDKAYKELESFVFQWKEVK